MPRKFTGSKLDALSADQQEELCGLSEDGVPLELLVSWVFDKGGITIGKSALGEWLSKRRDDEAYEDLLVEVHDAAVKADEIAEEVGRSAKLTESTITALSAALQKAIIRGNDAARDAISKSLAMVVTAHANNKKADAAVEAAGTATAKFQFDAAKSALAHAEELQEINRDETDEKTKVARAIKRLFGEKPKGVRTAAEVLAEEEEAA